MPREARARPRTLSAGNDPRQRGFTLLELLVALSIAALLMAITPPLISSVFPGVQLKGAARELAAALRYAHDRAIVQQEESIVSLDVEDRKYTVSGRKRVYSLPEKIELSLYTALSEQTDSTTAAIRFYPDGSSTGGGVTLSYGERAYRIDIDWLTGRVRLTE